MNRTRARRIGPRLTCSCLAFLGVAALGAPRGQGPRTPSIMAVMQKQYNVSKAPIKVVRKELDAASPDWEKVREASVKFSDLADALAGNTPTIGSAESWREQIERHLGEARALRAAADSKDLAALRETHRRIAAACKSCHAAHRARGE